MKEKKKESKRKRRRNGNDIWKDILLFMNSVWIGQNHFNRERNTHKTIIIIESHFF